MGSVKKSKVTTAFVLDFETGGLDCQKCGVTQLSMHAIRLDNFNVMDTMNIYFAPYAYRELEKPTKKKLKTKYEVNDVQMMLYEERAFEITGITMDLLESRGLDLTSACEQIIEFIKKNSFDTAASCKPFLVGQNVAFDIGFLTQIFLYTGLYQNLSKLLRGHKDYFGNWHPLYVDTIPLSQLALGHEEVDSWTLGSLSERMGIDLDNAHDADADVEATREILRVLTSKMRSGDSDGGGALEKTKKTKTREHFKI